jgi:acyl carrier protein
LARVLRLAAGDLDRAAPFTDFGLDSIGGVAFIGEVNRELGLDLRPMVLFDHGSVARLAAHLSTDPQFIVPVHRGPKRNCAAIGHSPSRV